VIIKYLGRDGYINNCACCSRLNSERHSPGNTPPENGEDMEFLEVGNQYICTDCVHAAYVCLLKEKSGG
jgi:hypothetical protein